MTRPVLTSSCLALAWGHLAFLAALPVGAEETSLAKRAARIPSGAVIELIQERYSDGDVKIAREVTQDVDGNYVNHGEWKMYDPQGTLVAEGEYAGGQRDGTWNRWYRRNEAALFSQAPYDKFAEPFVSQMTFDAGRPDGAWVIFDANQRKVSEIHFTDGQRDGQASWWYANGNLARVIEFADGRINGLYSEWSADGTLTAQQTYQNGRKLAKKIEHFEVEKGARGQRQKVKKSEGTYLHAAMVLETPDNWWNAQLATYSRDGNDERHGPWATWFRNGQQQIAGQYEHDVPSGDFTWWYSNGQIASQGAYEDGHPQGTWVWWHENGQKATLGEYELGEPVGKWNWWQENGRLARATDVETEGHPSLMPEEATAAQPQAPALIEPNQIQRR